MLDSARPAVPASLTALLSEIGPTWGQNVPANVKRMAEEFSKIHASAPPTTRVTRDVAYGAHERQQFDIFHPDKAAPGHPLVIFIHGGAFTEGHRNRNEHIYSNVSHYFARHGMSGINMNYRLAPGAAFPGASEDVAAVVRWARDNAANHGWSRDKIFLMGHSAGGAHAATYAYDKRVHGAAGPQIAGLMVISGRVRADLLPENPNAKKVAAYYGEDASQLDDMSPVSHVTADSVPTFIAMAQYENPLIDLYCTELAYRLAQVKRHTPPLMWVRGHNHSSIVGHINTAEDGLGAALRAFIADPS